VILLSVGGDNGAQLLLDADASDSPRIPSAPITLLRRWDGGLHADETGGDVVLLGRLLDLLDA